MAGNSLKVLYEDNHLLAVEKPPSLATMGAKAGSPTLLEHAKHYIARKYDKQGNVYLGVVSRLDAPVTGVVLMARTSKAAARLSAAFREREVSKQYLAICEGEPEPADATIVHHLRKDERHRKVHVTTSEAEGAQRAELSYRTLTTHGQNSLLLVQLLTGRKHQIRVQLAKIGCPLLGDRKYGSRVPLRVGIGLHAWRLSLLHPVRKQELVIESPPPGNWSREWRSLAEDRVASLPD